MTRTYFARKVGTTCPIKIGRSCYPRQRVRALLDTNGQRGKFEIILQIQGDYERAIHTLLWRDRIAGEWFRLSDHVRHVMDLIEVGAFDLRCLPKYQRLTRSGMPYALVGIAA